MSPPESPTQALHVDPEVLTALARLGFEESHVIDSVSNRRGDKACVAYSLILDNKKCISSGYLGKEISEGADGADFMQQQESLAKQAAGGHGGAARIVNQRVSVTERRWALGIHYRASPSELMAGLLKVLSSQGVLWKRGPGGMYNLKCVKMLHAAGGFHHAAAAAQQQQQQQQQQPELVKFELQVYRDRNSRYVLDIQRLEGHLYTFFDVVTALISELKS